MEGWRTGRWRPRVRPTRPVPTPPTGSIFASGAGASILLPRHQIRGSSALYRRASLCDGTDKLSVATIERRLSALSWNYAQRGQSRDRKDRHIATVLAGIRNSHAQPPHQMEALLPEDLIAMLETSTAAPCAGCATVQCCSWVIPAACGAPRSFVGHDVAKGPDGGRKRLGRGSGQGHCGDVARQDRQAGGRDRRWLVGRDLPGHSASDVAESLPVLPMDRCFAA